MPRCWLASLILPLLAASAWVGPVLAQPFPFPTEPPCGEAAGDVTARQELAQRAAAAQQTMDAKSGGVWRAAHDVAEQACHVGDRKALDAVFERCVRECVDPGDRYLAHVDYAGALERFGDVAAAEGHYLQAMDLRPGRPPEAIEAYNRYALLLERTQRPQQALDLLNRFSPAELELNSFPSTLRIWVMRELGMDTTGAEARAQRMLGGSAGARFGGPPPPVMPSQVVTIEVLADISVEPWIPGRERVPEHLYFFRAAMRDPNAFRPNFVIAKGQRLRMVAELGDGACRIELDDQSYDVDTCPWLHAPGARQEDLFRVVANAPPQ